MMAANKLNLRPTTVSDLEAVNAVIERAVLTWDLPERVKRLSLPSYRYHAHDLEHLQLVVAETFSHEIVGVAAWEAADAGDAPNACKAMLLHGIYVAPDWYRSGIGTQLLMAAEQATRQNGFIGLLVKAQAGAEGFFLAQGMEKLRVADPARDYPHRFWKQLS